MVEIKRKLGKCQRRSGEEEVKAGEMGCFSPEIPCDSLLVNMCACGCVICPPAYCAMKGGESLLPLFCIVPRFFFKMDLIFSGQSTKTVNPKPSTEIVQALICLAINIHLTELYHFLLFCS